MNGNTESDTNHEKGSWSKSFEKLVATFERLALYIYNVEWLTPVGKMNFFSAIAIFIIFIILAIRGIIQNTTFLDYLFAFVVLFIMSIVMSSRSLEANRQNMLKRP